MTTLEENASPETWLIVFARLVSVCSAQTHIMYASHALKARTRTLYNRHHESRDSLPKKASDDEAP